MHTKNWRALALTLLLALLSPVLSGTALASGDLESQKITDVKVEGNKRITESTILYYIHSKVGEYISYDLIREDIQRIYDLGHFEDVKVDAQDYKDGTRLTFILDEIPAVRDFKFRGNKEVKDSELLEKVTISRGAAYNKALIQSTIDKIKEVYQNKGFCLTKVTTKTRIIKQENLVDIVFLVKEGEKFGISKIRFKGNKAFTDKKLLKAIETKEEGWFSWITRSGIYKKESFKTDLLRIEMFYRDHGFLKATVGDPVVDIREKEEKIYITIPIDEGPRYKVSKIAFSGDETFKEAALRKSISIKVGEVFSLSKLREDISTLSQMYSAKGYAYADIIPQRELDDKKKTVFLDIQFDKGEKIYVGQINITGNTSSRDNVIRREFRLTEGELFDSGKLKRTKQRLMNTGFFEDVKITTKKGGEENLVNVDVNVLEKATGSISAGVGYSSFEKTLLSANVSQNNFLGYGQRLSFDAQFSALRNNYYLNFTEPYLFDREIQASVNLFRRELDYYNFSSDSSGAGFSLGKAYGEYMKTGIGYQFEFVEISNVEPENQTGWFYNRDDVTSRVLPYFTYDSRDDYFNPTTGYKLDTRAELGGLGGVKFYKMTVEGTVYKPLIWGLVGMIHGKIGHASGYGGETMPNYERFFMGGSNDLRGFSFDEVGPLDKYNRSMGGTQSLLINTELQYEIFKNFRALVFYDRGNVYGTGFDTSSTSTSMSLSKMRHAVGIGVRFFSPIGPIGLAYGWKLDKRPGERDGDFHFTMGGAF